jgi:hypothetical protein
MMQILGGGASGPISVKPYQGQSEHAVPEGQTLRLGASVPSKEPHTLRVITTIGNCFLVPHTPALQLGQGKNEHRSARTRLYNSYLKPVFLPPIAASVSHIFWLSFHLYISLSPCRLVSYWSSIVFNFIPKDVKSRQTLPRDEELKCVFAGRIKANRGLHTTSVPP